MTQTTTMIPEKTIERTMRPGTLLLFVKAIVIPQTMPPKIPPKKPIAGVMSSFMADATSVDSGGNNSAHRNTGQTGHVPDAPQNGHRLPFRSSGNSFWQWGQ